MGYAYLSDGTLIPYKEYIEKHPYWQKVRRVRFDFDEHKCVVCRRDLTGQVYHTHHLHYQRLGHERLRDVITLCPACHKDFHESWQKVQFWRGKESGHWESFSLEHTAQLCATYWRNDRLINKNPDALNLCSRDVCRQLLDEYFRDFGLETHPRIDPNDISLFVRNKRYEIYFEYEEKGLSVEEFLDAYYGPKIRGGNPVRQEAGRKGGPFDHEPKSFHRHYSENPNLNILMEEVRKLERSDEEDDNPLSQ